MWWKFGSKKPMTFWKNKRCRLKIKSCGFFQPFWFFNLLCQTRKLLLKQDTMVLWSKSSRIRSGGWRFESRRYLILLDETIEKLKNKEWIMQRRGPLRGTKIGPKLYVYHYISLRVGTRRTRTCLENHIEEIERRDSNYQLQVFVAI